MMFVPNELIAPASIPPSRPLQPQWDVRRLDWFQFEKLIALLFTAEGFIVERTGGANPDGGIDLLASKNSITFGVQCKHWKTWRVGIKEVRALFGAMHDRNIEHGFLVTLEGYTPEAAAYAHRNSIALMDEPLLLRNLEEVNWRFNPAFLALVKDKRKICPKCDSAMVLRTAMKGAHIGEKFWGCSRFPRCRFRMPVTTTHG